MALAQEHTSAHTWYVVDAYKCTFSNNVIVSYDQAKDENKVTTSWAGVTKTFYPSQNVYLSEANISKIDFNGHAPSAGPVLDYWETDYSMQFQGVLPIGKAASVTGHVYRNTAFTGWVETGYTVTCDILITSTF
jgi:hypothetical protein